jgi:hypothetical protein
MGYAFAKPHSLAYSFVGIQTLYLATNFPQIFWNCACLIVNAGGTDLIDAEQIDEDEIRATEQIIAVAETRINDNVVLQVSLGAPTAPSADRTAKVNSCRAALKAELAALRKREDEILQLLLAD